MGTKGKVALIDAVQGLFDGQDRAGSWNVRAFVTDDGVFVRARDIFNQTTHRLFLNISSGTGFGSESLYMRRFDSDDVWEVKVQDILPRTFVQCLKCNENEMPHDEYEEGIEGLRSCIRDFLEFLS